MRWRDENSSEGCKHKSRHRKQAAKIINHYVAVSYSVHVVASSCHLPFALVDSFFLMFRNTTLFVVFKGHVGG